MSSDFGPSSFGWEVGGWEEVCHLSSFTAWRRQLAIGSTTRASINLYQSATIHTVAGTERVSLRMSLIVANQTLRCGWASGCGLHWRQALASGRGVSAVLDSKPLRFGGREDRAAQPSLDASSVRAACQVHHLNFDVNSRISAAVPCRIDSSNSDAHLPSNW